MRIKMKMAENENKTNVVTDKEIDELLNMKWMVRPCETYQEEYSDCKSVKARFHQYFVHGEMIDCNSWKVDHDNCLRFRTEDNMNAYKELIRGEEKRREKRLRPHFENDIWKKRAGPPPDWDKPLPAWLEEENKATYLSVKAEEIRNHGGQPVEGERTMCVIS